MKDKYGIQEELCWKMV